MANDAPVGPTADVSVILVLWNCEQELTSCLRSLAQQANAVQLQVICIDNGSEDQSAAIARQLGADTLKLGANLGFPAAVNIGLRRCRAPHVLLLNPDVELRPDTVLTCLDALTADPAVGMVGCNLRRVDGSPDWAAARRFRSLSSIAAETFGITRLSPRLDFQYLPRWSRTTSRDVECINGAFMLLSTELLRELGGLDESAFMYLEDQELCRQIQGRNLKIRFVADAIAIHVGGASTLRASEERRNIAYLHRTDADIELMARLHGRTARLLAVTLFAVRAVLGLMLGVVRHDHAQRSKYLLTLRWLSSQLPTRKRPPPIL